MLGCEENGEKKVLDWIRKELEKRADQGYRDYLTRHALSGIGVRSAGINEISKNVYQCIKGWASDGIVDLLNSLWNGRFPEERQVAISILARISKKLGSDRVVRLVGGWLDSISDWAECDTLATQGVREIASSDPERLLPLVIENMGSKNRWRRRFAVVLCIELFKDGFDRDKLVPVLNEVRGDRDYYVKKALDWASRVLNKPS